MNGDSWDNVAMISIPRIYCPHCESLERPIRVKKLPTESDGSYTTRYICRECSERFIVVSELPEIENPFPDFDEFEPIKIHGIT